MYSGICSAVHRRTWAKAGPRCVEPQGQEYLVPSGNVTGQTYSGGGSCGIAMAAAAAACRPLPRGTPRGTMHPDLACTWDMVARSLLL